MFMIFGVFFFKGTERCMVKSFTDINKALSHLPLYFIFMCKIRLFCNVCSFVRPPVPSIDR